MMSSLAKASADAIKRNEHVTHALSVMANSCMKMLKSKKCAHCRSVLTVLKLPWLLCRFAKEQTQLFCARAMTGSIILYDHSHPLGVFHKRTPVAVQAYSATLTWHRFGLISLPSSLLLRADQGVHLDSQDAVPQGNGPAQRHPLLHQELQDRAVAHSGDVHLNGSALAGRAWLQLRGGFLCTLQCCAGSVLRDAPRVCFKVVVSSKLVRVRHCCCLCTKL
jgi:hypothetical protein